MIALTNAFSLSREPFAQDIPIDNLFPLPGLKSFFDRFDCAIRLGAATVITGEVGSTKSTSLRAAANRLHPAQYKIISMVATTGSTLELLRQICLELGAPPVSNSIAKLMKTIRELLSNISAKNRSHYSSSTRPTSCVWTSSPSSTPSPSCPSITTASCPWC